MATLADELLYDFEDSGSNVDEQNQNGLLQDDSQHAHDDASRNVPGGSTPGIELDGDEEEVPDAEEELAAQNNTTDLNDAPDEEETKARVEKMKLGSVGDVRNVAGLMKTLQPVLEVRCLFILLTPAETSAFTSLPYSSPDFPPTPTENRTLSIYTSRQKNHCSWIHRR